MEDRYLKAFTDDLNNIRDYITYINLVNNIELSNRTSSDTSLINFTNHLRKIGTLKKLFEYKAITISLYGILEKHIGLWIMEHIRQLPKIVLNYNSFPEKFRDEHFNLSVKLISLISENKFSKYEHLKKEDVLTKLNSCIERVENYELNSDAFYIHSGNLRHCKIADAFKSIDIQLTQRLKIVGQRPEGFLDGSGTNIANRGDDLFLLIDDIVIRRNEIAHGEDIDNILNVTEFSHYIEFIEGYGKALFQVLVEKNNQYEAEYLYEKIDKIHGIYKSHSILCFEINNNDVKKLDYIIIKHQDGSFIKKVILGIEKDGVPTDEFSTTSSVNIGVDLGGGLNIKQSFFIKKKGSA